MNIEIFNMSALDSYRYNEQISDPIFWGFLLVSYGVAFLSALILHHTTNYGSGRRSNMIPDCMPPPVVITIIWFVLFFFIAYAGYRGHFAAKNQHSKRILNGIFAVQLALLFLWTPTFFIAKDYTIAFWLLIVLLLLVLIWIVALWNTDRFSSILLVFYFIWLLFAAYTNWNVVKMNQN